MEDSFSNEHPYQFKEIAFCLKKKLQRQQGELDCQEKFVYLVWNRQREMIQVFFKFQEYFPFFISNEVWKPD